MVSETDLLEAPNKYILAKRMASVWRSHSRRSCRKKYDSGEMTIASPKRRKSLSVSDLSCLNPSPQTQKSLGFYSGSKTNSANSMTASSIHGSRTVGNLIPLSFGRSFGDHINSGEFINSSGQWSLRSHSPISLSMVNTSGRTSPLHSDGSISSQEEYNSTKELHKIQGIQPANASKKIFANNNKKLHHSYSLKDFSQCKLHEDSERSSPIGLPYSSSSGEFHTQQWESPNEQHFNFCEDVQPPVEPHENVYSHVRNVHCCSPNPYDIYMHNNCPNIQFGQDDFDYSKAEFGTFPVGMAQPSKRFTPGPFTMSLHEKRFHDRCDMPYQRHLMRGSFDENSEIISVCLSPAPIKRLSMKERADIFAALLSTRQRFSESFVVRIIRAIFNKNY